MQYHAVDETSRPRGALIVFSALMLATTFTLTGTHIRLLRNAVVVWAPIESGAAAVMISPLQADGEEEPGPALYADIARRAGLPSVDRQQIDQLLAEMPEALAQVLEHGTLEAGSYRYDNPLVAISFAEQMLPAELAHLAKEKSVSFAFTAQHAKLLRHARWRGLFMDPKRPYGDMTSFELDMADILKVPADQQRLWKLHTETLPALQIYLQKASIAPGDYPRIEVEAPLF
jgi:hypothetical protein